jgi:hypothetical protein
MKVSILFIFALLMSGCIPNHILIPEGYVGPTASISDSYSNKKDSDAHYFTLREVDGKGIESSWAKTRQGNYGQGNHFTPIMVSREVMPKMQRYSIDGSVFFPTDALMMFGDKLRVTGEFNFTPKVGEAYVVVGALSKSESKVWLEDSKGSKVSEVFIQKH